MPGSARSDRRAPVIVATADTPGNANDVKVQGSLAYIADGAAGLKVFDLANPLAPALIGQVDTQVRPPFRAS